MTRSLRMLLSVAALCSPWMYLALTAQALAAPVPRRSALAAISSSLTPDLLVGTWSYEWAGQTGGEIAFFADGTYTSYHGGSTTYFGRWRLSDSTVTLCEYRLDADGSLCGPQWYTFALAEGGETSLAGATPTGTRVVLGGRKR